MTVTVIAQITVNDAVPEKLAAYFQVITPLLERAGAKILSRFDIQEVVIGQGGAQTVVVVEYPDRDAVLSVFNSTEYRSIENIRNEAFCDYHISICESLTTAPKVAHLEGS